MNRSENAEARGNSRFNNFDLLRILSAAAVIVIHVNWHFFGARAGTPSTDIRYLAESVLSIVTHFAVPCFLMISGAFNLRMKLPSWRTPRRSHGVHRPAVAETPIRIAGRLFRQGGAVSGARDVCDRV